MGIHVPRYQVAFAAQVQILSLTIFFLKYLPIFLRLLVASGDLYPSSHYELCTELDILFWTHIVSLVVNISFVPVENNSFSEDTWT